MKKKHKHKGFTIVELIVVMAIIAILILIAIPAAKKYKETAKITYQNANANTINKATISAIVENYADPTTRSNNAEFVKDLQAAVDRDISVIVRYYSGNQPTYTNFENGGMTWFVYVKTTSTTPNYLNSPLAPAGDVYILSPINLEHRIRSEYKNGKATGAKFSIHESY